MQTKLSRHAHWLLRLALASVFLYHGTSKLMDIGTFSQMLSNKIGYPAMLAWPIALAETIGGLFILCGSFFKEAITRTGALLTAIVMLGALKFHWGNWSFMDNGVEFQVTLFLVSLYFVIKGNE